MDARDVGAEAGEKSFFFRFFRFFFALDVASLPAPSLLSFLETPTSIFLSPSS